METLLAAAIPEIAAGVERAVSTRLAGLCLGGGYGRGEGGVRRNADGTFGLYNDLDFFVFTDGVSRRGRKRIAEELEGVSREWSRRLGVEVDFGPPKNLGELGAVRNRLMFQELKYGHWQILGDSDVLASLPQLPESGIPLIEGVRLMVSRGMGLLLAAEQIAGSSGDGDFIRRNLNKAVLGTGDAILIAAGRYRWRAVERRDEIAAWLGERGDGDGWAGMYASAVDFKFMPEDSYYSGTVAAWCRIRDFWAAGLGILAGGGGTPEAAVRRLRKMCFAGEGRIKNALRWLYKIRSLAGIRRLLEVPLVRVLSELSGILLALTPEALASGGVTVPRRLRRGWLAFQ